MDASSETPDGHALVGRETELAVLRRALDAARAGRGGVVVIEGMPGSGKTRLAREAAAEAGRRGFRVVWAHCAGAVSDDRLRDGPVLVVDDRCGPPLPAEHDLSRLPVLVVATKTVSASPGANRPWAGTAGVHATRLRLRPLRHGALVGLATSMGAPPPIVVLERLHAATGGNALLVVETLAALARADPTAEAEPWPLSGRLLAWTHARLEALSPAGRNATQAASVLGDECDVGIVTQLIGADGDPSQVGAALAEFAFTAARHGGTRCRIVPPLVRELVYASIPAERRSELHGRAAKTLVASGMLSPAVQLHRALAACAAGDGRRCAYYVFRLAEQPAVRDAPTSRSGRPYFVREGEHWAIGFGGRAIRMTDRAGLLYLARLLARPRVALAARELGERVHAVRADAEIPEPRIAAERARVRVTRRIRDAMSRITRAHPALGAHLARTVRTGAHCAYMVDPRATPRWEVRWP